MSFSFGAKAQPDIWRLLALGLVCVPLATDDLGPTAGQNGRRFLQSVVSPKTRYLAYRLGVAAVAAPPVIKSEPDPGRLQCPVEIRAIISGDSPETTFAVLAIGEYSTLLGVGQGARTPLGWIALAELSENQVVVRLGDHGYVCPLGLTAAQTAVELTPESTLGSFER